MCSQLPNALGSQNNIAFVGQSVVLGTLVLLASPISLPFVSGETDLWRKIYDYLCTFDQEVRHEASQSNFIR